MLTAVVWWTWYKALLLIMKGARPQNTLNVGTILPGELNQADLDVLRLLQLDALLSETRELARTDDNTNGSRLLHSGIRALNPMRINGLLRVGGRLMNSSL